MDNTIQKDYKNLAKGSIKDVAEQQGKDIAEVFLGCTKVVILDSSGSMNDPVEIQEGESNIYKAKFEIAEDALRKIQGNFPGQVALVEFSSKAEFVPDGIPKRPGAGTNLIEAMNFVKPMDIDVDFVIISDGQPNEGGSHSELLDLCSSFTSKIDTIYIGPTGDRGEDLMKQIASKCSGKAQTMDPGHLAEGLQRLMLNGKSEDVG